MRDLLRWYLLWRTVAIQSGTYPYTALQHRQRIRELVADMRVAR